MRCASLKTKAGPRCVLREGHEGSHFNGASHTNSDGLLVRGTGLAPDPLAVSWTTGAG